jgi:hypothetical protein
MVLLALARALVAAVPFERWRGTLGSSKGAVAKSESKRLAAQIEWAAQRSRFSSKCLPRAMALSWLLRARGISHEVVFGVRPAELRTADEALHAWVEIDGQILIGELPGPWLETLRLGKR